jgi:hypothetical protein
MGTDPASLTKDQLNLMVPEDRQVVAAAIGHPNAGLTTEEAQHKYLARLERQEPGNER